MDIQTLTTKYAVLFQPGQGIETGDGWYNILDVFLAQLVKTTKPPKVKQIKEKFGRLRIHLSRHSNTNIVLIEMTQDLADRVCERCGAWKKIEENGCKECSGKD